MADLTKQPAKALLGKGTTRSVDLTVDPSSTGSVETLKFRGGATISGRVVSSGVTWTFHAGRRCLAVASGIGNGWFAQYELPITLVRPVERGALALREGIARFVVDVAVGDLTDATPNRDCGVDILVGTPSGIADLRTANNTHLVGASGFSLLLDNLNRWRFLIKYADTAAGDNAEFSLIDTEISNTLNSGSPNELEFRIFDATFIDEAKLELYVNGAKLLTRYWVNPSGVTTPTLPPFGIPATLDGTTGAALVMQLVNTSLGPPQMFYYEPTYITGSNDSGTL